MDPDAIRSGSVLVDLHQPIRKLPVTRQRAHLRSTVSSVMCDVVRSRSESPEPHYLTTPSQLHCAPDEPRFPQKFVTPLRLAVHWRVSHRYIPRWIGSLHHLSCMLSQALLPVGLRYHPSRIIVVIVSMSTPVGNPNAYSGCPPGSYVRVRTESQWLRMRCSLECSGTTMHDVSSSMVNAVGMR